MKHSPALALFLCAPLLFAVTAYGRDSHRHFWQNAIDYSQGVGRYLSQHADDSRAALARHAQKLNAFALESPFQGIVSGLYAGQVPPAKAQQGGQRAALDRVLSDIGDMDESLLEGGLGDLFADTIELRTGMPYFGIGYGREATHYGFGFIADLGVAFGDASTRLEVNDPMRNRLMAGSISDAALADAEIAWQCKDLTDTPMGGIHIWPQASVGISYRF